MNLKSLHQNEKPVSTHLIFKGEGKRFHYILKKVKN
jgi:hypothetical protein